jgi:hypothetical protein
MANTFGLRFPVTVPTPQWDMFGHRMLYELNKDLSTTLQKQNLKKEWAKGIEETTQSAEGG